MATLDDLVSSPDSGPVAVRMAQSATLENLDPGLFAFFSSPDVATAMVRSVDVRALRSISWVSVASSASGLRVEHGWPEPLQPPPVVDLWWQLMATWLVRTATKVDVVPTRVEVAHPVADPQAYEDYLGIAITPGTSNVTEFSAADARLPLLTASDLVWESFEPLLRKRLREFEFGLTMQEEVRSALLEVLPTGEDSLEAVARLLAVGARTLQRQLREEGVSYSEILTDTRKRLADHYLKQGYLNNSAIARRLGYQDSRSFARAFKSWTGMPIKQAREEYEAEDAPT